MGLGLSALVALVLLLPGLAFVLGLNRLLSPSSPSSPFDQHFSVGLLAALLAAFFFHGMGVAVLEPLCRLTGAPLPAPDYALLLLGGGLNTPAAEAALRSVAEYPLRITGYFFGLTLTAFLIGRPINRWIARRSAGKGRASWYDLLRPRFHDREIAFIVLTAEVSHSGKTWLYSGFLDDFLIGRDGTLERIVFRDYAQRRPLELPADAAAKGTDTHGWIEIPGEQFVLVTRQVQTFNIDYFFDEPSSDDDDPRVI